MCSTSLRRLGMMIAVAGLAVLAGSPSWAQVGGNGGLNPNQAGGRGKKKGFGNGGFGVGPGGAAVVLPEGLNHVPYDAAAFVHIRVADSLNGPASQALLKQLRGDGAQGKFVAQVEKRLGVRLADVDSITLFMLDMPSLSARTAAAKALGKPAAADAEELPSVLVILTYSNAIDRKAVLRALAAAGESSLWPKLSAVFLSDRCVLFGAGPELLKYTTGSRGSISPWDDGPGSMPGGGFSTRTRGMLSAALAAGAEPHLIVAGAQVPALARARLRLALRNGNIGPYGALLPLLNTTAAITVDLRDAAEMNVRFLAGDRLALEAAQSLPTLAEIALDGKMPADSPFALSPEMRKAVRKAIAAATIAPAGNTANVEMRLSLQASPDELARLLAQAVVRLR